MPTAAATTTTSAGQTRGIGGLPYTRESVGRSDQTRGAVSAGPHAQETRVASDDCRWHPRCNQAQSMKIRRFVGVVGVVGISLGLALWSCGSNRRQRPVDLAVTS